jgi:hypothetical protein
VQNAALENKSALTENRIRHFGDQNSYMAALARGDEKITINKRDANGDVIYKRNALGGFELDAQSNKIAETRTIDIGQNVSKARRISAATTLVDRGETDPLRYAWEGMDDDLRATVNDTHGAKIAEIANDVSGRSSWNMGEKQVATQDDETLRNFGAEWYALSTSTNTTDRANAATMLQSVNNALDTSFGIQLSAPQRQHLQWIKDKSENFAHAPGGRAYDDPDADKDYAGRKAPASGIDNRPKHSATETNGGITPDSLDHIAGQVAHFRYRPK